MKRADPIIDVTIYLWGDALDPAHVSSRLGIEASLSRRKGDKRTTRTNKEITAKTGVWTLSAEAKQHDLSSHIQELVHKLDARACKVHEIDGVEGAQVDIHVVVSTDKDGEGQYNFTLQQKDLGALQKLGLPIEFTFDVVKE